MTDQFKNDQIDESREEEYIAAAFDQLYADQLDKDLRKHGIHRERPGFVQLYLRPLMAAAAGLALLVAGWWAFQPSQPDALALADNYLSHVRVDYTGEVRKSAGDSPATEDVWAPVMDDFHAGNYPAVIQKIESMPPVTAQETPEKRDFYKGLCYLLQSPAQLDAAATALAAARKKASDPRDCDWLLALTYIRMGNYEAAKMMLTDLEKSPGSFRKKDVEKLLKSL